jgi:hypothetical protein
MTRAASLVVLSLFLVSCSTWHELTFPHQQRSDVLGRASRIFLAEGFKPADTPALMPTANNPGEFGCHKTDDVHVFEKEMPRSNNFYRLVSYDCDGQFKIGLGSGEGPDMYDGKIFALLQHEFQAEIANGQVTVKTQHYVPLGP